MRIPKNLKSDEDAGIEGLPLQLMIMVVIAGVGTAIILGWMANLTAPASIADVYSNPSEIVLTDGDRDGVYSKVNFALTVTVLDQEGDGIKGATVTLQGASLSTKDGKNVHGITDEMGRVTFSGLSASQYGEGIGFITVTVAKSDHGTDSSLVIPVVSE